MMHYMIPLLQSFLPIWREYLIYFFALAIVAFSGCFIHALLRR